MRGENVKRMRPLRIWEILSQETDEDHPMTSMELLSRLSKMGLCCDRRTLYQDIDTLVDAGYEVMKKRTSSNEYYVMDRSFDIPELHILMDAVQASKFITEKKTEELVAKIAILAGSLKGETLKRNLVAFSSDKSRNETIYYSVNAISEAVAKGKKISFLYFDYNEMHERVYRHNAIEYVVNPIGTVFSDDKYYMLCVDDKHEGIATYRVDKMEKVTVLDEKSLKTPEQKEIGRQKSKLFGMFAGEKQKVTFEAKKEMIDVIFDEFGDSTKIYRKNDERVSFTADVQISPAFIGWCASFGDKIKVVYPLSVISQIKEHLKASYDNYT